MTQREIDEGALASWLSAGGRRLERLEPLPGDVSPRRYARAALADGGRAIVAFYPPEARDGCRRFERTTALLHDASIPVPRILESDCRRGLMLLEDAGSRTLFDLRSQPLARRLPHFESAVAIAARIAALPTAPVALLNPPLDGGLLRNELRQTIDRFLAPRNLLGDGATRRAIETALTRLCAALAKREPVPCHRDFMARNLVPAAGGGVTVLDHQDLRLGPPGYDLASLLNDSFFPPAEIEARLSAGALPAAGDRRAYHRAAAQRTLKAVGTFAAFAARGFERHLPLIPPTLSRALHHLALAPETSQVAPELERLWAPVLGDRAAGSRED